MTFEAGIYTISAFLLVFGTLFLVAGYLTPPPPKNTLTRIRHIIHTKNILFLFGLVYISLAHFGVYAGLAYGIEYTNLAPCENVIVNSTDVNSTSSTYDYADSCANRTTPEATQNFFTILTWLIFIDFFTIMIAALLWWGRKWTEW